jgi:peptidoglycan L-alanyl-D-glutamate endopeptidase CwlK
MDSRSQKNLEGVHPDLVKVITNAKTMKPGFIVVCGVRTTEEQQALYAQGRTKPGLRITNCDGIKNKSNHQPHDDGLGYAVDVYADANDNDKVDTLEINDVQGLSRVAENIKSCAKELGTPVEWGGDWKIRDYPHFELKI